MDKTAREEYLSVLAKVSERIWIPRQVVNEFHKNRISSVSSHVNSLAKKSEAVKDAAGMLNSTLRDFAKLRSLADGRTDEYLAPLNDAISKILSHVENDVTGFDLNAGKLTSSDPILERLAVIFDGRVGEEVSAKFLTAAKTEAKRRGDAKIPPGYKDIEDKGEEGYGDYLIWTEMMNYAKATERDVLFISTDMKEDWVLSQAGFSIGARPELVREMRDVAQAGYVHTSLAEFLRRSAIALSIEVSQDTIEQVKNGERREDLERRNKAWNKLHMEIAQLDEVEREVHQGRKELVNMRARQNMLEERVNHHRYQLSLLSEHESEDMRAREAEYGFAQEELAESVEGFQLAQYKLNLLEEQRKKLATRVSSAEREIANQKPL
ncbi:PIN-like domain-containing protein [Streptomyces sp. CS7]|nr:PIN-like domain-containing protein [Streptomyces sp. CS-7]